jgi:hypothetical protein
MLWPDRECRILKIHDKRHLQEAASNKSIIPPLTYNNNTRNLTMSNEVDVDELEAIRQVEEEKEEEAIADHEASIGTLNFDDLPKPTPNTSHNSFSHDAHHQSASSFVSDMSTSSKPGAERVSGPPTSPKGKGLGRYATKRREAEEAAMNNSASTHSNDPTPVTASTAASSPTGGKGLGLRAKRATSAGAVSVSASASSSDAPNTTPVPATGKGLGLRVQRATSAGAVPVSATPNNPTPIPAGSEHSAQSSVPAGSGHSGKGLSRYSRAKKAGAVQVSAAESAALASSGSSTNKKGLGAAMGRTSSNPDAKIRLSQNEPSAKMRLFQHEPPVIMESISMEGVQQSSSKASVVSSTGDEPEIVLKASGSSLMRSIGTDTGGEQEITIRPSQTGSSVGAASSIGAASSQNYPNNLEVRVDVDDGDLVHAQPVLEDEFNPNFGSAQPVDMEEAKMAELVRAEKQAKGRRKLLCLFFAGLILVGVVVAIVIIFVVNKKEAGNEVIVVSRETAPPTPPPTPAPTPPPTAEAFPLPEFTKINIENFPDSPQARAYQWLLNDPNFESYPQWRKGQRFALMTLYYATDGENWFYNENWARHDVDECEWALIASKGRSTPCIGNNRTNTPYAVLYFRDNNLRGTIPPELMLLRQVRKRKTKLSQFSAIRGFSLLIFHHYLLCLLLSSETCKWMIII